MRSSVACCVAGGCCAPSDVAAARASVRTYRFGFIVLRYPAFDQRGPSVILSRGPSCHPERARDLLFGRWSQEQIPRFARNDSGVTAFWSVLAACSPAVGSGLEPRPAAEPATSAGSRHA